MKAKHPIKVKEFIEKGIYQPRAWSLYGLLAEKMEIGDSILFDTETQAAAFRRSLYRRKKLGSIRKVENWKFRLWRVG